MEIPDTTIQALGELEGPIGRIVAAVSAALDADDRNGQAVDEIERAVVAWLERSQIAEDALLEVLGDLGAGEPSAARAQALVRYVAVQQLHVAIAAEIAWVDPPAGLQPGLQRVLGEVAFGPDGLIDAMISDDPSGNGAGPGSPVDGTVEAIVDQAKDSTLAIGRSLPHNLPTQALALVRHVARLAPQQIDRHLGRVARRIRRCIGWLLRRVRQALDHVPQWIADYAEKIAELLKLRDRIAHAALAGMLGADGVKRQANRDFNLQAAQPHRRRRANELRDLVESNKRWVGPVETVAPATGVLWGIPVVGPVTAGAIADTALLVWTLVISGDQLDSFRRVDLWRGVIRIAAGRP